MTTTMNAAFTQRAPALSSKVAGTRSALLSRSICRLPTAYRSVAVRAQVCNILTKRVPRHASMLLRFLLIDSGVMRAASGNCLVILCYSSAPIVQLFAVYRIVDSCPGTLLTAFHKVLLLSRRRCKVRWTVHVS